MGATANSETVEEEADGKNPFSYEFSFIVGGMSWVPQLEVEALQTIIPKERMTFFVRIHLNRCCFLIYMEDRF
jgi:hypothetical protein